MKPVEKMSFKELLEAQRRHKKILSNKTVLHRLPDKGQKFIEANGKIDERLQEFKEETDGLSEMLSEMTLSVGPRFDVNQIEWNGNISGCSSSSQLKPSRNQEVSDDESRDIVDILLTTNQMSKIIIDERIPSTVTDINAQDQCYKRLAEKVENLKPVLNHQFKPFKTLKHEQDPLLKQFHKWDENTAATPPTFKYNNGAKTIQIEESLKLQVQVEEKLKLLEQQRSYSKSAQISPDAVTIHPEEHEEIYDDEPEGAGGGIAICVPVEVDADLL